jgi:3-oxoacyl-[acyl-carrier-protein] synthase II
MTKYILVVDDDRQVLQSLERLFKKEGYNVVCASSGKEALEKVERGDFDLVIIDIKMPDLDGVETVNKIKEIKKNQSKPSIPVIFITGYADIDPVERAKQLGDVVLKPFDLEDLLSRVKHQSTKRRVVITGLGVVAPNGIGKDEFWKANIEGKSGVDRITSIDVSKLNSKIAAQIKDFDPLKYMPKLTAKKVDRFTQFGIVASKLALEDSKLNLQDEDKTRIGVAIGTGLGGMLYQEEVILQMHKDQYSKVDPLSVLRVTSNAASSNVAIILSLTGPNVTLSTACSSGAHGIGYAYDMIKLKRADIMFAGGSEAPITPFTLCTFDALKALSTHNDFPEKASRPFDKERDGFVMGEGAGILILEELEHALKRNAHVYAEIIGYGLTSGAYHMAMPAVEGKDIARTMSLALKEANVDPKNVNYINAHGTSTVANDKTETQAIKEVFGDHAFSIPISSTKSMIGHTLGASGAIGAIVCALTIENNVIPPTINYENRDPECDLDYVPNKARSSKVDVAIANSFGFGNNNISIVIQRLGGQHG